MDCELGRFMALSCFTGLSSVYCGLTIYIDLYSWLLVYGIRISGRQRFRISHKLFDTAEMPCVVLGTILGWPDELRNDESTAVPTVVVAVVAMSVLFGIVIVVVLMLVIFASYLWLFSVVNMLLQIITILIFVNSVVVCCRESIEQPVAGD